MKSNAIKEIERFAQDREIDKMEHNYLNYATNVFEELCEGLGYDVPKENRENFKTRIKTFIADLENQCVINKNDSEPTRHDVIDSISDIRVFSITELQKLNACPEMTLMETAKEVNSRVGKIVNGKFEKELTDEAKSKWYKADYEK